MPNQREVFPTMTTMSFLSAISFIGYAIEVVGVVIILLGTGNATLRYIWRYMRSLQTDLYHNFRREMGRAMLVGLEFLVAGDIIRTVVVVDTITDVASLGLVVLIRTVLVFTIHLEVEGHWPWQAPKQGD
jgi:uncharacterized membrane protein